MTTREPMTDEEAENFRETIASLVEMIEGGKCVWAAVVVQTTEGAVKLASRHAPGSVKLPK